MSLGSGAGAGLLQPASSSMAVSGRSRTRMARPLAWNGGSGVDASADRVCEIHRWCRTEPRILSGRRWHDVKRFTRFPVGGVWYSGSAPSLDALSKAIPAVTMRNTVVIARERRAGSALPRVVETDAV